jgi:dihydrofolate reductase
MQTTISRYMTGGWSLLAGRTTYEDLYEGWHVRQPTSPMTKALTSVRKFVVTRNASYRLPWANSTLVAGEGADEVARLKEELETTLIIFGSGELVRSLMGEHLVDEFVLMIHPLILGEGRRLFDDDTPYAKLSIIEALPLDTGAIVALYRSAS